MNVRSRSYSALPAPLYSSQYLQAVSQEIRVWSLAAGAIFPEFLVGCSSIFVPISLDSFAARVTVERTEVLEPPQIAVEPQSDGMGWTVSARQRVREHQRVDLAERWKGNRSEAKGNIGTVVAGALLCPVGALYGIVVPRLKCGQGECVGEYTGNTVKSVQNDRGGAAVSLVTE
jgi:hypothetical protein